MAAIINPVAASRWCACQYLIEPGDEIGRDLVAVRLVHEFVPGLGIELQADVREAGVAVAIEQELERGAIAAPIGEHQLVISLHGAWAGHGACRGL